MTEYDPAEVRDRVDDLPGWSYDGDRLRKTYEFDSYMDGIDFVNAVAPLAEDANHHPDLVVGFREVEVTLKSHDVDAITDRDWDLIDEIEDLD
jgi:4a-hydroxytetrahydrobiopterin dehydratase